MIELAVEEPNVFLVRIKARRASAANAKVGVVIGLDRVPPRGTAEAH